MRVAAIYDIHGNLPAVEAVLAEIRRAGVDHVVVGGDVLPGPMPVETLDCLLDVDDVPVQFLRGNGDRAVLEELAGAESSLPEPVREVVRWTARQLHPEQARQLASWPETLRLEIPGLGKVLFCHATPRNDTEIFTRLTPAERLLPVFAALDVALAVCGHTHMQFDRRIGSLRVVNAGSVGMPFGEPGAYWLLLGPDVRLQHTIRSRRSRRAHSSHELPANARVRGAERPAPPLRERSPRRPRQGRAEMRPAASSRREARSHRRASSATWVAGHPGIAST